MFHKIHKTSGCIAAAVAALLLTTSCLDKEPGSAIPEGEAMKSYADAEQVLVGIYAQMKSAALFSGYLTLLPDIQADLVYAVDGYSNTYGNIWQWDIRSTTAEVESVYGALYSVISTCNFYLDNIDRVTAAETDDDNLQTLEEYTGEVYCVRALCYSKLLECFCKAYDPDTAASEPGVVLRTRYFESEPAVRATLERSYAFVIEDLERAEARLSADDDGYSNDFLSLAAAQALHARVALDMRDWEGAVTYASKLIDRKSSPFALSDAKTNYTSDFTYFDYMWAYDLATEIIWRVGFTTTSYGGALGQVFLNFNRDYTYFYPDYVPAQWVLDLYDTSDLRYSGYFAGQSAGVTLGYDHGLQWPLLVKYYGNRNGFIQNRIYHVSMPKPFRLAEQYLIRAEAYCRLGRYGDAGTDLTALRRMRYASGGAMNVTSANWLQSISDERVRELYMEGFRLNDLKRWGREYAALHDGYSFVRTPQQSSLDEGSSLKVAWDDPLFVWPIPQHELEAPGSEIEPNESNR